MSRGGKYTRRTALGLIGAGGLLAASETFGFTSISAGRGISVFASDDANALLSIEGADDTSVTPTFTNRSSNYMSITINSTDNIEFDLDDNGDWIEPPVTFSLAAGASQVVNIRFAGECTDAGTATVDVDADLEDDSGTQVGSISLTRDFEIPQSGQAQFSGTAKGVGGSGKYEFEIENTGCIDVTLDGIGINETTATADSVSKGDILVRDDTRQQVVSTAIPIDNSDPTSATRRDMSPTVTLQQNQAITFEFDRFQNGNKNVMMDGHDVRITLYFGDGSSATIKLCLGTCDF